MDKYLKGDIINNLTFLEDVSWKPRRTSKFLCTCGKEFITKMINVKRGYSKSCGCLMSKSKTKHGQARKNEQSIEYRIWSSLKNRCYNTNNKNYSSYGGRGIKVCNEWIDNFEQFLEDMGKRPSKNHSIDRVKNNEGYSKQNCRWAISKEQQDNRRNSIFIEFNDKKQHIIDWCKELSIGYSTLLQRLKRMSVEDALKKPVKIYNYNKTK